MSDDNDFNARLAIGKVDGANSAVFRFWIPKGKSDVYAGVREIAGEIKISLHESGECFAGLTRNFYLDQKVEIKNKIGDGRHQSKWTRQTQTGDRIVTPLQISIPSSELRVWRKNQKQDISKANITWIDAPEADRSVIISCIFSGQQIPDDKYPGKHNQSHFVGSRCLPNGEKFWLLWQDCYTSNLEREVLSNARARVTDENMVPLSNRASTGICPRNLIFKEFKRDHLVLVVDAAGE